GDSLMEDQLHRARTLIDAKRYTEAYNLLLTIKHPTATEWLKKLDEMGVAPDLFANTGAQSTFLQSPSHYSQSMVSTTHYSFIQVCATLLYIAGFAVAGLGTLAGIGLASDSSYSRYGYSNP